MARIGTANLASLAVLAVLLIAAGLLRLALIDVPGHTGDVIVMSRWAEWMVDAGPWQFYRHSGSVYPALLYPLWALGALYDGADLTRAIKALSIPFDLALAGLLFALMVGRIGPWRANLVAVLYLFNPAVILAGPIWGQVDAAGTLFLVAALASMAGGRFLLSGGLTVLAGAMKPQFALAALPMAWLAIRDWRAGRGPRSAVLAVLGMVAVYLAITISLDLGPRTWASQVTGAVAYQAFTSRYAFNPWGLLIGFDVDDAPYVLVGALLLLAGLAASLLLLRTRRDLGTLLAVGLLLVFALYFLPTRVHERYLFPAMALGAPFAVVTWRCFLAYLLLTGAFTASLLYALAASTSFDLPPEVKAALLSTTGIWVIGVALIGSSLALAYCVAFVGRARLASATADEHRTDLIAAER